MMKKAAFLVVAGGAIGALVWFVWESSPFTPSSATRWLGAPDVEAEIRRDFPVVADSLDKVAEFEIVEPTSGTPGYRTVVRPFETPSNLSAVEAEAIALRAERDGTDGIRAFFPKSYGDPFETFVYGMRAAVTPAGRSRAEATLQDGKLFYADAYRDTDVLYTADRFRIEEFLYLRSEQAPIEFEYTLETDVTEVFLHEGAVHLTNGRNVVLVIERPWLIDAEGRRNDDNVWWELDSESPERHQLRLRVDPAGLDYPLLVDPSWRLLGLMNQTRQSHTATLLQDGTVLVTAGAPTTQSTAEIYDPRTGTFTFTGSLAVGRSRFPAVLLPDGQVLVIGGVMSSGIRTAACEIYNPQTGAWSPRAPMNVVRGDHTATLLRDGRVLVVGGSTAANVYTNSVEIYDPGLDTWTLVQPLNESRGDHTATLLNDSRVLVAAGNRTTVLQTAEIYDVGLDTWTNTPNMNQIHNRTSATLLRDGRVLMAPGSSGTISEYYDVGLDQWFPTAGNVQIPRSETATVLLPNGKVLLVGGGDGTGTAELFDPATDTWSTTAATANEIFGPTATLLPSGQVLLTGGVATQTAEVFDPEAEMWVAPAPTDMAFQRRLHTATLLPNGKVLVTGGFSNGNKAELYDPAANSFSAALDMATSRYLHTATLFSDGKVLVAGGFDGVTQTAAVELYDPGFGTWLAANPMNQARDFHTATLLHSGKVLVAGGFGAGGETEVYDPVTGLWTPKDPLNQDRFGHTATLLPDNRVLVTGGSLGAAPFATAELYEPSLGSWSFTGPLNNARTTHTATLLPDGDVLVAGGFDGGSAMVESELYSGGAFSSTGPPERRARQPYGNPSSRRARAGHRRRRRGRRHQHGRDLRSCFRHVAHDGEPRRGSPPAHRDALEGRQDPRCRGPRPGRAENRGALRRRSRVPARLETGHHYGHRPARGWRAAPRDRNPIPRPLRGQRRSGLREQRHELPAGAAPSSGQRAHPVALRRSGDRVVGHLLRLHSTDRASIRPDDGDGVYERHSQRVAPVHRRVRGTEHHHPTGTGRHLRGHDRDLQRRRCWGVPELPVAQERLGPRRWRTRVRCHHGHSHHRERGCDRRRRVSRPI